MGVGDRGLGKEFMQLSEFVIMCYWAPSSLHCFYICIFIMIKILSLVFALSVTTAPILAWGEGGCSLSNKNKASQDETIEQVDSSDSSDR